MFDINNISSLLMGGAGTSAISTYLGVNPTTAIVGTTIGGFAFVKLKKEIIDQKNMYPVVNNIENYFSHFGKTMGFGYYSLKINDDSIIYFKFLSYLISKFDEHLIHNNSDYIITNQVKLTDLQFNIVLHDEYFTNKKKHSIIIYFSHNNETECDNITLKSRTLNTCELNKYVKNSIIKNTNKTHITLYQPEFTRYEENSKSKNNDKKLKTTVKWKCFFVHTNKNINNTIVSDQVKDEFLDDLHNFVNSEDHYNTKGIPYKRGYLLYGPPGTGKTSLIKAAASTYGMDVYLINMGEVKTSDDITKLFNGFRSTGNYHIVCFEDIDKSTMFTKNSSKWDRDNDGIRTLLNELDGINEGNKRITIFTANDVNIVENVNALCRPGRIDKKVMIDYCTPKQVCDLFNHYTSQDLQLNDIKLDEDITPACVIKVLLTTPLMTPSEFKTKLVSSVDQSENMNSVKNTSNVNKSSKGKIRKSNCNLLCSLLKTTTKKRAPRNKNLKVLYRKYAEITKTINNEHKRLQTDCDSFSKSIKKQKLK